MRILEVSRYKNNFADHQLPFVTEQGEAIASRIAGVRCKVYSVQWRVESQECRVERDFWDKMAKIGEIFNKCEVALGDAMRKGKRWMDSR